MTKTIQEQIKELFKDYDLQISRVKKFEGFITPNYSGLYWCYERPSYYKVKAFDYCENLLYKLNRIEGVNIYNYGIVSYCKMQFTYAINFTYQGKKYCYYITKCYNTLMAEV